MALFILIAYPLQLPLEVFTNEKHKPWENGGLVPLQGPHDSTRGQAGRTEDLKANLTQCIQYISWVHVRLKNQHTCAAAQSITVPMRARLLHDKATLAHHEAQRVNQRKVMLISLVQALHIHPSMAWCALHHYVVWHGYSSDEEHWCWPSHTCFLGWLCVCFDDLETHNWRQCGDYDVTWNFTQSLCVHNILPFIEEKRWIANSTMKKMKSEWVLMCCHNGSFSLTTPSKNRGAVTSGVVWLPYVLRHCKKQRGSPCKDSNLTFSYCQGIFSTVTNKEIWLYTCPYQHSRFCEDFISRLLSP